MANKIRHRAVRLTAIVFVLLSLLLVVSMAHTQPKSATNYNNNAITSEYGKATFIGNYELNVSFTAFPNQSSVVIFYSQSTITKDSANITLTTQTYGILKNLEIGTYNIDIVNGTTTPSSDIFTGTVPISSALEHFNVAYLGNGIFNISFKTFTNQNNFRVYYAKGNSSMLNANSNFVTGTVLNYSLIKVSTTNMTEYSFLVVNDSIFPSNVNISSYVVTISPHSESGFFIGYDSFAIFLSQDFVIFAVIVIAVIIAIYEIGKHSGKHGRRE